MFTASGKEVLPVLRQLAPECQLALYPAREVWTASAPTALPGTKAP